MKARTTLIKICHYTYLIEVGKTSIVVDCKRLMIVCPRAMSVENNPTISILELDHLNHKLAAIDNRLADMIKIFFPTLFTRMPLKANGIILTLPKIILFTYVSVPLRV